MSNTEQHNFHWIYIAIIIVLTGGLVWYYEEKIEDVDERRGAENEMADVMMEMNSEITRQLVDDRALDASVDGLGAWEEVAGSPFEMGGIEYQSSRGAIFLSSGEVKRDSISGLVWSAPSEGTVSNGFVLTEAGQVVGGEVLGFCAELARVRYAGLDNWTAPTQKQLMQAYVNGGGRFLADSPYYVWSITQFEGNNDRAWRVNLQAGDVSSAIKGNENGAQAICVGN